ncbi:hypothetical protein HanPSC8_Chr09g0365111 [Helianthus annuus]|nr:hypothetical protein HanPSC8_Chr09g0365111 [Helianthus annuus]
MFSSYVRRAMSSKFGSCGFYLDESQVLSCFVVLNFRCMCRRLKTMLWYFVFKT